MDKIEFFLYIAGPSGVLELGRRSGVRCGLERRGRDGDSGGRGQGHRLRRARHRRWTAGGRQREGNGGGAREEEREEEV